MNKNTAAGGTTQSYKPIRALERGLVVLSAIGEEGTDVGRLSEVTGINRTTIYRILTTLEQSGYLVRSTTDHHYRLTHKVRNLSDGFTDSLWITKIAGPVLRDVLNRLSWPGTIATFDGTRMLVRESTIRYSPLMTYKSVVGERMPLSTSLGIAFLAFSSKSIQKSLMSIFTDACFSSGIATDTKSAMKLLEDARKKGYAVVVGIREPGIGGVSMPIKHNGLIAACMNIVLPAHVLTSSNFLQPIVDNLSCAVHKIEQKLEELPSIDDQH